jgi:hypothetical protein
MLSSDLLVAGCNEELGGGSGFAGAVECDPQRGQTPRRVRERAAEADDRERFRHKEIIRRSSCDLRRALRPAISVSSATLYAGG